MKPEGPKYQQKSYSIPSPEQDYFAGFAMRHPVLLLSILASGSFRFEGGSGGSWQLSWRQVQTFDEGILPKVEKPTWEFK